MATESSQGSRSSPSGFYLDLKKMEKRNVNNTDRRSPMGAHWVCKRFK